MISIAQQSFTYMDSQEAGSTGDNGSWGPSHRLSF
jgi:hypothetical protein